MERLRSGHVNPPDSACATARRPRGGSDHSRYLATFRIGTASRTYGWLVITPGFFSFAELFVDAVYAAQSHNGAGALANSGIVAFPEDNGADSCCVKSQPEPRREERFWAGLGNPERNPRPFPYRLRPSPLWEIRFLDFKASNFAARVMFFS